jgi:hypothetical protein
MPWLLASPFRALATLLAWTAPIAAQAGKRDMASMALGRQAELWQALIVESATRRQLVLDEYEESYLGFVLMRHMRDASLAGRVMALDWLQAEASQGTVRSDALRDVGDRCLLIAGLFPQLAARRRVSPDYFVAVGRDAYAGVALATRAGYAELFAQLARAFGRLVDVLAAMRTEARMWPGAWPAHMHGSN